MAGVTIARPAQLPGWMLDEVAGAGRENLDAEHVRRYDGKENAGAADEVALLRARGLGPDSVLIDIGAGTGQLTLAVAPLCARVIAVDVSPIMLQALREKVTSSGLGNIEVVQAGFLTYEHTGAAADVVYSRYALHHLPDAWKAVALTRMRRMLRPGGLLRLSDVVYHFDPQDAEDRLEAWCATGGDGIVGEWSRAEYEEHVRDEHSTFTWLLEPMIRRAGFEIEDAHHSDDGIFARYLLRAAGTD
jgi:ubiquinone/menaquinone biosynthesis C-methylase UbiE